MANVSYQVKLYDTSGAKKALFVGRGRYGPGSQKQGTLVGFNFWKRLRTAGNFNLFIDGEDDRIAEFVDDAIIEIERRDVRADGNFVKVYEGFHRMNEYAYVRRGLNRYTSRGRGFNDLLASDVIFGDVGSSEALKSGASETVAKDYVNENIGPGANPDDLGNSRAMSGLTIQADAATGASWSGDRAYSNLLDVLLEIANYAPGDFGVVGGASAGSFIFKWAANQWGLDKTKSNGVRPPVIFSPSRRNVQGITIFDSRLDEANAAYVLGQGVGDQKVRVTRINAAALAASPWARRAVARDASDEDTVAGLNNRGDETLDSLKATLTTRFQIINTPGTRWVRDWDVGDLVTVEHRDFSLTQKIIGVRVSVNSDGDETIGAEATDA